MTYPIHLNFGRVREVDPSNGMTSHDFEIVAFNHFGVDFWINQNGGHSTPKEHRGFVNYYFNLWHDTLKHCAKVGSEPCFDSFMGAVAQGDC